MRKLIICLLVLYFLIDSAVYAAGPSGGYGGSRGGNSGSGNSYGGSGHGGRPGGYSGPGNFHQGSHGGGSHAGSNNYHGNGGYHGSGGYRGYHGAYPYHGKGSYHHGRGNSYRVRIGGSGYPGYWGPVYPRYYSYYYSYPSYGYPYAYAPGVFAEQPQLSAPAQEEQDRYWYYCENPRGYYPYVKSCPGGWMQVVPETAPPTVDEPHARSWG